MNMIRHKRLLFCNEYDSSPKVTINDEKILSLKHIFCDERCWLVDMLLRQKVIFCDEIIFIAKYNFGDESTFIAKYSFGDETVFVAK